MEVRWEPFGDRLVAAVDFAAAADAVQGVLPCSDGERQVLLVAASIAEGIPVDLREAALCMDAVNAARAAQAVCHAAGRRVTAGDGGWPVTGTTLPGTVVIMRPRHPLAGRELRVLGGMRRHGRLELLLVLPDGSKRLIPAEWTSQHADGTPPMAAQATAAGTARGRWDR